MYVYVHYIIYYQNYTYKWHIMSFIHIIIGGPQWFFPKLVVSTTKKVGNADIRNYMLKQCSDFEC
jgi:hypothetical protein